MNQTKKIYRGPIWHQNILAGFAALVGMGKLTIVLTLLVTAGCSTVPKLYDTTLPPPRRLYDTTSDHPMPSSPETTKRYSLMWGYYTNMPATNIVFVILHKAELSETWRQYAVVGSPPVPIDTVTNDLGFFACYASNTVTGQTSLP